MCYLIRYDSLSNLYQQLENDVKIHGPVLAVLTVIGGLDTRPRLGGLVQHEELGEGTIAEIESKARVIVLFHERKNAKICTLNFLRPVSLIKAQQLYL